VKTIGMVDVACFTVGTPKTNVHTKEDADHSLPYLLAVALYDRDVQMAQLDPERIARPDVQNLLLKVKVRPDDNFTARFPAEFPARITVRLKNGQSLSHEVSNYPGFPTRPLSWNDVSAKFDKLVAGHVGAPLGREIKDTVHSLEDVQVTDLTKLLGKLH
jgi:2-methylcitrate dehydratase